MIFLDTENIDNNKNIVNCKVCGAVMNYKSVTKHVSVRGKVTFDEIYECPECSTIKIIKRRATT